MTVPVKSVPVEKASHRELVLFAREALGLDIGSNPTRDSVASKLIELGHDPIWVSNAPEPEAPLEADAPEEAGEYRTHPDEERWVYFRLPPERDADGKPRDSVVPVSVNDRSAVLPRGRPVWAAEIFFAHLKTSCVEERWAQDSASAADGQRPGVLYSYNEPRFDPQFIKYGGLFRDNPVPTGYRKGDVVVGPDNHVPPEVLRAHLERVDPRVQAAA